MAFLGVDLGTQGCRTILVEPDGLVLASSYIPMSASVPDKPQKWSEQRIDEWWPAVRSSIRQTLKGSLKPEAVSVDSTSGTVMALSDGKKPLTNAIMYNDTRSELEAEFISEAGRTQEEDLGYRIRPSFSAAKLLWLRRNDRKTFDRAWKFVHAADYVNGCLCGNWEFTDHTNALKSGFDLIRYEWPDFLEDLGISRDKLPTVVAPGEQIGVVTASASSETGIPLDTPVLAGLTDGCASQIASGAADVGDWETTLGTTLVIKGVTRNLIRDSMGRIYSHLHPERYWMPGGASNTGGETLATKFQGADLGAMDESALARIPTGLVAYPLARTGERFPFVSPDARGFLLGKPADDLELYASHLEGVGFVERMAYDVLVDLGAEVGNEIYTVGGGARSEVWMRIRASILGKSLLRPRVPEAAMGMAILAASSVNREGLGETARNMVKIELRIEPDPEATGTYIGNYERFRDEIEQCYPG